MPSVHGWPLCCQLKATWNYTLPKSFSFTPLSLSLSLQILHIYIQQQHQTSQHTCSMSSIYTLKKYHHNITTFLTWWSFTNLSYYYLFIILCIFGSLPQCTYIRVYAIYINACQVSNLVQVT